MKLIDVNVSMNNKQIDIDFTVGNDKGNLAVIIAHYIFDTEKLNFGKIKLYNHTDYNKVVELLEFSNNIAGEGIERIAGIKHLKN